MQVKTWYQNRRMKWKKIVSVAGGFRRAGVFWAVSPGVLQGLRPSPHTETCAHPVPSALPVWVPRGADLLSRPRPGTPAPLLPAVVPRGWESPGGVPGAGCCPGWVLGGLAPRRLTLAPPALRSRNRCCRVAAWSPPPSPRGGPRRTPSPRASSSRSRSAPGRRRGPRRRRARPASATARTERGGGGDPGTGPAAPAPAAFQTSGYYFECGQFRAIREGRRPGSQPRPQRAPAPQSGRVAPSATGASSSELHSAIHAPLLAHTSPRPPAGRLGSDTGRHTPASTPWGPGLRVQSPLRRT